MEKTHGTEYQWFEDDRVVEHKHKLFNAYVIPYTRMIYKLCIQYTCEKEDIPDNYTEVLTNLYKYILTYDPSRSIKTWIHIVTKRCVFDMDKKHRDRRSMQNKDNDIDTYIDDDSSTEDNVTYKSMDLTNYEEWYNDDILAALNQLKPCDKRALLLQQAGYKLKEIAEIEYRHGTLESGNINTIKSRLFLARKQLQELLTSDGETRKTNTTD